MSVTDSHNIPVQNFEINLIWPVLVQVIKGHKNEDQLADSQPGAINRWVEAIQKENSHWRPVHRAYPNIDSDPEASRGYSEFCYFHPFVRNFLYLTRGDLRESEKKGLENPINRNLRLLERKDIADNPDSSWLDVWYDFPPKNDDHYQSRRSRFHVASCWLYLFDTKVAMVELQLQYKGTWTGQDDEKTCKAENAIPLMLNEVMKLQDAIRYVYTPYWDAFDDGTGKTRHIGNHVPDRVRLTTPETEVDSYFGNFVTDKIAPDETRLGKIDEVKEIETGEPQADEQHENVAYLNKQIKSANRQKAFAYDNREPHTAEFWQSLIAPIVPVINEPDPDGGTGLQFEHIQDERIPMMSYVSVGDNGSKDHEYEERWVRKISPGDWVRLAALDDPGASNTYPYSPEFFANAANPLDGFCYDRFWHSTGRLPGQDKFQSTRWLCSGYSFVAVGDAGSNFFKGEHAGALCHFRHHYFALSLIAFFYRASLLRFKHKLAEISDEMHEEGDQAILEYRFREKADLLSKEFMRFRTLYWFSEVSNQVQGIELFSLQRNHLNLETLFDEVVSDIESAAGLLRQWDAQRQSDNSMALAWVGALFAIAAPVVAALSRYLDCVKNVIGVALINLALACLLAAILLQIVKLPIEWKTVRKLIERFDSIKTTAHLRRILSWGLVVVGGIATAIGLSFAIPSYDCDESGEAKTKEVAATEDNDGDAKSAISIPANPKPKEPDSKPKEPDSKPEEPNQKPEEPASDSSPAEPVIGNDENDKDNEGLPPDADQDNSLNKSSTGSKPNEDLTAPQKPNSGNAPPDQDAGDGGE